MIGHGGNEKYTHSYVLQRSYGQCLKISLRQNTGDQVLGKTSMKKNKRFLSDFARMRGWGGGALNPCPKFLALF